MARSSGHSVTSPTNLRWVLLEDRRSDVLLLRLALEGMGVQLQWHQEIVETLRALASAPPDLFVLDLQLRDGWGTDVLEALHRSGSPSFPVVVLTGSNDPSDHRSALDRGADDVLIKPESPQGYRVLVGRLLERYRVQRKR